VGVGPETDRAREALLSHFTDQLVSHAGIILTIGILAFTFLRTWLDLVERSILRYTSIPVPALIVLGCLGTWQVFRFLYHGCMAGHVMHRKPIPQEALRCGMERNEYFEFSEPTDIYAVYKSAKHFERTRHRLQYDLAHIWSREPRMRRPAHLILYSIVLFFGVSWFLGEVLVLLPAVPDVLRILIAFTVFVPLELRYWDP